MASETSSTAGEVCFVCSTVILEAGAEREGEPALLCEGRHKRWVHASCAGVSTVLYDDICSCETPWMCQDCSKEAAKALQELPALKDEVQLLKAENTGLREELAEVRGLLTSLYSAVANLETKVTTVADTVDLLQATPTPVVAAAESEPEHARGTLPSQPSNGAAMSSGSSTPARPSNSGASRSTVVKKGRKQQRKKAGGNPGDTDRGLKRMGNATGEKNAGSGAGSQSQERGEKVQVQGKRRIWGTLKACSSITAKQTTCQLTGATKEKLQFKRKFKKLPNNKTRWWHIVSGDESDLEKLEGEWESVKIQTGWKLEKCYIDENFLKSGGNSPPT